MLAGVENGESTTPWKFPARRTLRTRVFCLLSALSAVDRYRLNHYQGTAPNHLSRSRSLLWHVHASEWAVSHAHDPLEDIDLDLDSDRFSERATMRREKSRQDP